MAGVRPRSVVVLGAGISGLTAALALARDAPEGTTVTVVEGSRRIGGKLDVGPVAGLAVDSGAETFLARAPEGVALARAVGLGAALTAPVTTGAGVLVGGQVRPLPGGTVLGVPADLDELARSRVLSPAGLARAASEPPAPLAAAEPAAGAEPAAQQSRAGSDGQHAPDVAVGRLVRDRLGDEVVDRLVDPLLGGVYAGRADALSLQATVPALARALPGAPSLLAAAGRARSAAGPGTGPVFATLPAGLGTLPAAVAAHAEAAGVRLLLGRPARELRRTPTGWSVVIGPTRESEVLAADAVVLALPAAPAARLLQAACPTAAAELAAIDYASVAIVTLAYPGEASLPAGSGVLVPTGEGYAVKAVTFSSRKWAHLSGSGVTVVRASIGRYGEVAELQRDDADLSALVCAELHAMLDLPPRAVEARITRWGGSLPQYAVGHVARVARIRAAVAAQPGLAVCGAAYDGVGVPACIRTGERAAAAVVASLVHAGQSEHDRRA